MTELCWQRHHQLSLKMVETVQKEKSPLDPKILLAGSRLRKLRSCKNGLPSQKRKDIQKVEPKA